MANTSTPTPWPVSSPRQICYEVPPLQTSLVQASVNLHFHVAAQGIGDRTGLISLLRGVLESFGVEVGDPPVDVEDQRGNLQLVDMEGACGTDAELLRLITLLGEGVRERHRETAGVSCGDEFLGAGLAVGTLRTRSPGDRQILRRPTTRQLEGARTLLQIPPPHNIGAPLRLSHTCLQYIYFLGNKRSLPTATTL